MIGCRRVRGLMAGALYEPLSPDDQIVLNNHFQRCPRCRAEADELRIFIAQIPAHPVEFQGDLRPVLLNRFAEEKAGARPGRRFIEFVPRLAFPIAAVLAVLVAYGAFVPGEGVPAGKVEVVASPMEQKLVEARTLAKRDFMAARTVLEDALRSFPEDPRAGEAQLALADLEFDHGQRYEEAYKALNTLRTRYPETWNANPECADRFDLLDEARAEDFEPLYAYAAAVNSSGDAFAQLEKVVARYPEKLVGTLAMAAMVELVGDDSDGAELTKTAALDAVRNRCTDPIAIAAVSVSLGDSFWKEMKDPDSARICYTAAAQSSHPGVAQSAKEALASLDAMAPAAGTRP